jgi:hypothetical protein
MLLINLLVLFCSIFFELTLNIFFKDKEVLDDFCIGPNTVRALLRILRAPYPVESADIDDCLLALAEGRDEQHSTPRIKPVPFEKWYRKYYDEG